MRPGRGSRASRRSTVPPAYRPRSGRHGTPGPDCGTAADRRRRRSRSRRPRDRAAVWHGGGRVPRRPSPRSSSPRTRRWRAGRLPSACREYGPQRRFVPSPPEATAEVSPELADLTILVPELERRVPEARHRRADGEAERYRLFDAVDSDPLAPRDLVRGGGRARRPAVGGAPDPGAPAPCRPLGRSRRALPCRHLPRYRRRGGRRLRRLSRPTLRHSDRWRASADPLDGGAVERFQ